MIWFEPTQWDWQQLGELGGCQPEQERIQSALSELTAWVEPERPRWVSPVSLAFLKTVENQSPDARPMLYPRFNQRGRRWTASRLLDGVDVRLVDGQVDVVLLHGNRAVGVRLIDGREIRCRQRVVLSAGTIASPAILMRSGVGPESILRDCGIRVRVKSERVGQNLQDHLIMPVIFGVSKTHRFSPIASVRDVARWQTMGTGPISSNLAECGGLFLNDQVQLHVTPTHYLSFPAPNAPAAMTIGVNVARPLSRGRIRISSADASDKAIIHANYLSESNDLRTTTEAVGLARSIAESGPLRDLLGPEILPGKKRATDRQLAKAVSRYAQTLYHPVGTCAIGRDDESVCDARGFVRGVESLQVMDASLLPRIPTGNPSVTILLMAMMVDW